MHLCLCVVGFRVLLIRGPGRMEPVEGPPVSSPDPAIIPSVEQPALSSTHVVTDMPSGSPAVPTHTAQLRSPSYSHLELASVFSGNEPSRLYYFIFRLGLSHMAGDLVLRQSVALHCEPFGHHLHMLSMVSDAQASTPHSWANARHSTIHRSYPGRLLPYSFAFE